MESNPTFTLVVAAAIFDPAGRLLLQQGLPHKRHAGQWEFPGGKVEDFETPRFALRREVREELALELNEASLRPVGFAEEWPESADRPIVLMLYRCPVWSGVPQPLDGQQWRWFNPGEAALLPMPRMDRELLGPLLDGVCR